MSTEPTVFFGSDAIALPLLRWMRGDGARMVDLRAVITQPDRPHGRGMKLRPNPVKAWASEEGISVFQPDKPGPEEAAWIERESIAFALVMAYGHILRKPLLQAARYPMLNLHASLLPRYRGASPINAAIAKGDRETGVSLMQMVRRMDAGPVYAQARVPIAERETVDSLASKIATAAIPLVAEHLPAIARGELSPTPQDDASVTHTRLIRKEDGALDFNLPAETLDHRCRALHPWPGSYCQHGSQRLRMESGGWRPHLDREVPLDPGTVLALEEEGLPVRTTHGVILWNHLQRPGGKMLPARDFLRGYDLPPGTRLPSIPAEPLVRRAK